MNDFLFDGLLNDTAIALLTQGLILEQTIYGLLERTNSLSVSAQNRTVRQVVNQSINVPTQVDLAAETIFNGLMVTVQDREELQLIEQSAVIDAADMLASLPIKQSDKA